MKTFLNIKWSAIAFAAAAAVGCHHNKQPDAMAPMPPTTPSTDPATVQPAPTPPAPTEAPLPPTKPGQPMAPDGTGPQTNPPPPMPMPPSPNPNP